MLKEVTRLEKCLCWLNIFYISLCNWLVLYPDWLTFIPTWDVVIVGTSSSAKLSSFVGRKTWRHISILGRIVKIEATLDLSILEVFSSHNDLAIA